MAYRADSIPEAEAPARRLGGAIDSPAMRAMHAMADADGDLPERAAADCIATRGLSLA